MQRWLVASLFFVASSSTAQDAPLVVKAAAVIDGKGGVHKGAAVVVQNGRIVRIEPAATKATYDLARFTVLPGMIDTHVHLASHFGKDGRIAGSKGETPGQAILYSAENAYVMLMAGFTTVQSIGSASDLELREAIARGRFPGPRLLTSIDPLNALRQE